MSITSEAAEQNIIAVRDEEFTFFDSFTKKYGISWTLEERKAGILPLSKSYVGYITTPVRVIALNPKYSEIGFEHILRIYLYVYGYRKSDSASILDISESDKSIDVADMFLQNLRRNIQEGIIRTYRKSDTTIKTVKGKVNYPQTYINCLLGRENYVSARISALSLDNSINSLIVSALAKLQHIEKYSSSAREISMYFTGAKANVTNGSKVLASVKLNSNTARYRRTLTYAAMIIDQMTYNDVGNVIGTDSFLINFDRLFEDFVAKVLKEIPEKKKFSTWASKRKFADVINKNGSYDLREYQPDIVYRFIDEDPNHDYMPSAYAVLDVKNKAYGQFKNADIYQMLTYIKLLHAQKGMLLYPAFYHRPSETLSLDSTLFNPSVITACFVNIADESGEGFLNSIRIFADTVVNSLLDIL